ncbi:hypothetical protein HGH93_06295 [Chitinophaga polysaccharea]|uniref:lanthionine synthetase LanC family protein n=1 Tax=Chitinophaga polysaccharea TaxID=1293035 RepID=UPI00145524CB|nr:lanthionine synthetase LanC family protein [Chitinophaga polysaccharea]NLR57700.1 hypothetical protein [Chitinophaga polysaccharea]
MINNKEKILNYCYAIFHALETQSPSAGVSNLSGNTPGRGWRNGDNIHCGYLGTLMFELQLYEATLDPKVLKSLLLRLPTLERTLANTYNYSFAFGRMGLVYFYIQLYRCTEEREHLTSALKIVRHLSASHLIYFSLLSDCSVNNGAAGILAVLMELYVETKEDWLLSVFSPYFDRIIQRISVTESGLSWVPPGTDIDEAVRLAHDTEITAVLLAVAHLFSADHLRLLMNNALPYEPGAEAIASILCKMAYQPTASGVNKRHKTGILLLEAYEWSHKTEYLELSRDIVSEYLSQPLTQDRDYSLASGHCGVAYFLLRWLMEGKSKLSNVFFPATHMLAQPAATGSTPEFLDEYTIHDVILDSQFRASYKNWEEPLREEIMKEIFKGGKRITLGMFADLDHKYDLAIDLTLLRARFTLTANKPEEEFEEVLATAKIVTLDQETFMKIPFCISPDTIVINEPGISADMKIAPAEISTFFAKFGSKSMVCRMGDEERLDIKVMNLSKLIFDNLTEPCTGNEISKRIVAFTMSQPPDIQAIICKEFKTRPEQLELYIGTMVFEAIKSFMGEGMIEVAQTDALPDMKTSHMANAFQVTDDA